MMVLSSSIAISRLRLSLLTTALVLTLFLLPKASQGEIYYDNIQCDVKNGFLSTKEVQSPKSLQKMNEKKSKRFVVHDSKKQKIGLLFPWDAVQATAIDNFQVKKNEITAAEFVVVYQDKKLIKNRVQVHCRKD